VKPVRSDSPLLRVLKGTIASLPAYQHALADAPPAFTELGLRYSRYSEDSIDRERVIFGATERYDIDVTQLWIEAPVGANWSVALDVQNDYMTGASPWFVGQTAEGEPGVIMSGASIQDNRVEVGVATRYFWADGNAGFTVSHSDENDYEALAIGADVSWNSADNSRTWSTSFSSSRDTVEPTRGVIPVFIDSEDLDTQSAYFGVSQILSKTAIVRVGLSYTLSQGFLTDPYKLADARPDEHRRVSLALGYRKFMIDANGALQLDYRYYDDDWGTDSHTLEAGWTQNFESFTLTPYLRYYSQREADFFAVIADQSQPFFADDYRLSSFGAVTAGMRGVFNLGDWRFEAQAERYVSNHDWGLFDGDEAPALVDFWRATVGISWRFD
jgi:hypothetical protein